MVGHRLMGTSLLFTGDIVDGRAHFDQALALYDPVKHRSLATRFGQDVRCTILSFVPWLCGCSAIRRPHWPTQMKRSKMPAR